MKRIILLFVLLVFISGCAEEVKKECSNDNDCSKAGCSGQICTTKENAKDIITTCEWKEEYSCYQLTSCGCVNNKCQWKENEEFNGCLGKFK